MSIERRIAPFSMESCIAGTVIYPPGGTYGPRMYREIQLILLHSGSIDMRIDGKPRRLSPARLVLVLPGQEVYIAFDKEEESWHRWVSIVPEREEPELIETLSSLPDELPISWQMNQLLDLMLAQESEGEAKRPLQDTLGLAALQLFAAECLKRSDIVRHPTIAAVKSLIHERYAEAWTLAGISEAANVSASHLGRLFREQEGVSPMKYLWRYRVEQGIQQLRTTGLAVGEVAERCRFQTPFHFARLVKQHSGRTATELRALHWSGRPDEPHPEEEHTL